MDHNHQHSHTGSPSSGGGGCPGPGGHPVRPMFRWEVSRVLGAVLLSQVDVLMDLVVGTFMLGVRSRDVPPGMYGAVMFTVCLLPAIVTSLVSLYVYTTKPPQHRHQLLPGGSYSGRLQVSRYSLHAVLLPLPWRCVELCSLVSRCQSERRSLPQCSPEVTTPVTGRISSRSYSTSSRRKPSVKKTPPPPHATMFEDCTRTISDLLLLQVSLQTAPQLIFLCFLGLRQLDYQGQVDTIIILKGVLSALNFTVACVTLADLPTRVKWLCPWQQLTWWWMLKPLHFGWHFFGITTRALAVATFANEFGVFVLVILVPTFAVLVWFRWYAVFQRQWPPTDKTFFIHAVPFYFSYVKSEHVETFYKCRQMNTYIVYYMVHFLINSLFMLLKYIFPALRRKRWYDAPTLLYVQTAIFPGCALMSLYLAIKAFCHLNLYMVKKKPKKKEDDSLPRFPALKFDDRQDDDDEL